MSGECTPVAARSTTAATPRSGPSWTLLREAGVKSYTIYRSGEILFSHMEVEDYEALVERFDGDPVAQRWEEEMSELISYPNADPETGWPERLREVWDLG